MISYGIGPNIEYDSGVGSGCGGGPEGYCPVAQRLEMDARMASLMADDDFRQELGHQKDFMVPHEPVEGDFFDWVNSAIATRETCASAAQ